MMVPAGPADQLLRSDDNALAVKCDHHFDSSTLTQAELRLRPLLERTLSIYSMPGC